MRAGWDQSQKDRSEFLDFLKMFEAVGVQAVAIHPRTKAQQYAGSADWTIIRTAVESQMAFPIIGNGDVITPEDAYRMHRETGCQAVMIGRGALYNPFIFQQILDPNTQGHFGNENPSHDSVSQHSYGTFGASRGSP